MIFSAMLWLFLVISYHILVLHQLPSISQVVSARNMCRETSIRAEAACKLLHRCCLLLPPKAPLPEGLPRFLPFDVSSSSPSSFSSSSPSF
jgi:hypothetical protein